MKFAALFLACLTGCVTLGDFERLRIDLAAVQTNVGEIRTQIGGIDTITGIMAVGALALLALTAYPMQRWLRLRIKNGRNKNGNTG